LKAVLNEGCFKGRDIEWTGDCQGEEDDERLKL